MIHLNDSVQVPNTDWIQVNVPTAMNSYPNLSKVKVISIHLPRKDHGAFLFLVVIKAVFSAQCLFYKRIFSTHYLSFAIELL